MAAFADAKPDVWSAIHEKLQLAQMPPSEARQPTDGERTAMAGAIAVALRSAGHHLADKLALPNYGNYNPDRVLFSGPAPLAPATLVRAWRVRPEVYERRVPTGSQPFSLLSGQQVSDYASLYEVDESAAEVVLSNAQALVERWTQSVLRNGIRVPEAGAEALFVELLDPQVDPAAGKLGAVLKTVSERVLGRPLTPGELEKVRGLYAKVLAAHGRERAVRTALTAPFVLPDAYYRLEIGSGEPDEHGRRRLGKDAIVAAIQQTLFGHHRPPRLQQAFFHAKTTLGSGGEVAALVRELLDANPPGTVQTAVELIERLAASKRAEEMFVRYAFRFFLGRNETPRDARSLREAHQAYVASQGSMKTLVASPLSSDSFLYRIESP